MVNKATSITMFIIAGILVIFLVLHIRATNEDRQSICSENGYEEYYIDDESGLTEILVCYNKEGHKIKEKEMFVRKVKWL